MVLLSAGMDVRVGAPGYERHRTELTLLYQFLQQYYPAFLAQLATESKVLPDYLLQEFVAYLEYSRLEHGFLRIQRDGCHAEQLLALSRKRRGACPSCGA